MDTPPERAPFPQEPSSPTEPPQASKSVPSAGQGEQVRLEALHRLQAPVAQQPDHASPRGFPFGTHSGTRVSLVGFGLLGLSLFLPIWPYFFVIYLLDWDVASFDPHAYLDRTSRFLSLPPPGGIVLLLTCGVVAQGLVVSAFFSTLHDLDQSGTPKPRVWRIIALVVPLLGSFYLLALWSEFERSPALEMLIPIFGFLIALGGTLWQRRLARQHER